MIRALSSGGMDAAGRWLDDDTHRRFLAGQAGDQFAFFRRSLAPAGGFHVLGRRGEPVPGAEQGLHASTRLVHSYALGKQAGFDGCDDVIDAGMQMIRQRHADPVHGGYAWGVTDGAITDGRKLAYGHVFVLLAAASAKMVGHPEAGALLAEAREVLDARFWVEERGLFKDEWNRDWSPIEPIYRGMNSNMHGTEALMTAYEATGEVVYLIRAQRIFDFFLRGRAAEHNWRIPEHYSEDWQARPDYDVGDPIFRPPGSTPGHSLEFARLVLQCWDLSGRPDDGTPDLARNLIDAALSAAWDAARGGLAYTVSLTGTPEITTRFWWPITEGIGALAAMQKLAPSDAYEMWYRRFWTFAEAHLIDPENGGWFPELGDDNAPAETQFSGKPDIYHAVQADLFPLAPGLSHQAKGLAGVADLA